MVGIRGSRTTLYCDLYFIQNHTKMKIIHVIYLALLPLSTELGIEVFRTRVLGRNDKHAVSAGIRLIIMLIGALTYQEVHWAVTLSVMITLHYLVFNYGFNYYGMERHWSYVGNNLLDRWQKPIDPTFLLILKIILFALSITLLSFQ